jgi:hypothetical protein
MITELADDSGLHGQVLASHQMLRHRHPDGVDVAEIGAHAWSQLPTEARARALTELLRVYVMSVHDEQRANRLEAAARDEAASYLRPGDEAELWDSLHPALPSIADDPDVLVSSAALLNVLSELELLQHRLATRPAPTAGEEP